MDFHFWSFGQRGNGTKNRTEEDRVANEGANKVISAYVQDYVLICLLLPLGIYTFAVESQIISIMMVISPSEFRANLRKYFDLAHTERVIIRRSKGQSFALVPTHDDELTISDQLKKKIAKAREDFRMGKGTACKTVEDSLELLESL